MLKDKLRNLLKSSEEVAMPNQKTNCKVLDSTLRRMGCEVKWEGEANKDKVARFEFQGGCFSIIVPPSSPMVCVLFPNFFDTDIKTIDSVREVCNQVNINSEGPRVFYDIDEDQEHVHLYFLENIFLDASHAQAILVDRMTNIFRWRLTFYQWMDSAEKARKDFGDDASEEGIAKRNRVQLMVLEHAIWAEDLPKCTREEPDARITVADFVSEAMGLHDIVPSRMDVSGNGIALSIDAGADNARRSEMNDYALSSALIDDGKFIRRYATLNLVFFLRESPDERRYLTITLVAADASKDALYFQATAALVPLLPSLDQPGEDFGGCRSACSLLMAHDLKSEKSLKDEFLFMWQDAKDKLKNGQSDELTEEQRIVARVTSVSLASSLYHGTQLFLSKRYFEALRWLRRAFTLWAGYANEMTATDHSQFQQVCFMLGYCCDAIGQYGLGYYYLSLLNLSDDNAYLLEMINNLAYGNDPRTLGYINSLMKDIREQVKEQTGKDVDDYTAASYPDFRENVRFLLATRATVLANRGHDEEAEKELKSMLRIADLTDLAAPLLARLRQRKSGGDGAVYVPQKTT